MAEPAAESAPASAGKQGGVVPILLAANVVMMAGILACVVMLLRRPAAAQAAPVATAEKAAPEHAKLDHEHPAGGGPTVRLADFVVRLRNTEAERFARISFELEVGNDKDKEELTKRQPQIRDAFIAYLSDRSAEELRGSEGLAKAKTDLQARATETAPEAHVAHLYITDFVVQ